MEDELIHFSLLTNKGLLESSLNVPEIFDIMNGSSRNLFMPFSAPSENGVFNRLSQNPNWRRHRQSLCG